MTKTTKEVEKFLGFANYHRTFIKLCQNSGTFEQVDGQAAIYIGNDQREAFDHLIDALTSTPVFALPNSRDMFILDTGASDLAIGAELVQLQDGKEQVIAYGRYSLIPEQQHQSTTRKEKNCWQ